MNYQAYISVQKTYKLFNSVMGQITDSLPQFLSGGPEALLIHSCWVFSQHPGEQKHQHSAPTELLCFRNMFIGKKQNWPQGSVHRWTRPVTKEVLPRACIAPPALSRTRCPGRCSSPRISSCGSGKSFWRAHSARRLSWPHGNLLCRSLFVQTQEPTPSAVERKL